MYSKIAKDKNAIAPYLSQLPLNGYIQMKITVPIVSITFINFNFLKALIKLSELLIFNCREILNHR